MGNVQSVFHCSYVIISIYSSHTLKHDFCVLSKKKKYGFFGSIEHNDFLLHSYCNNIVYSYIFKLNNVGDSEIKYVKLTSYNILSSLGNKNI